MEVKIMYEIAKRVENGENVAMVTLVQIDGSSPGKKGNIMAVFDDGTIMGTVGGGNLEFTLIKEARKSMEENESRELEFELVEAAALHMKCGGSVKAFIKIFKRKDKVIIIGGGHVGGEIYKVAKFLELETAIFDDREEFCNYEKFPGANELIVGDIGENLKNYKLDKYSYVVIVSRGHKGDKDALREVIKGNPKYIGMIGSRAKIIQTYDELMKEGIKKEKLESVYSPMGLDISNGSPKEIAISVMAEILKIKNNLSGKSMKEVKIIKF